MTDIFAVGKFDYDVMVLYQNLTQKPELFRARVRCTPWIPLSQALIITQRLLLRHNLSATYTFFISNLIFGPDFGFKSIFGFELIFSGSGRFELVLAGPFTTLLCSLDSSGINFTKHFLRISCVRWLSRISINPLLSRHRLHQNIFTKIKILACYRLNMKIQKNFFWYHTRESRKWYVLVRTLGQLRERLV